MSAPLQISCALPTTLESPEHAEIAEQLDYRRLWLYDTPQQSPDGHRPDEGEDPQSERVRAAAG